LQELVRSDPGIEVVWRAFELRPDPVPTLDPGGEYLQSAWTSSVYPLARKLGQTLQLPHLQPRSRRAHEAARWAREQGRFDAYHEAVFRAFFERGEDIGDVAVLSALADGLGLDGEALRRALDSREHLPGVLEDERQAEALGLRGVPAIVANRRAALSGVQPVENLRQLVARARSQSRPVVS
jgi:predicted DsbA family dithiol-disulfide isomerase